MAAIKIVVYGDSHAEAAFKGTAIAAATVGIGTETDTNAAVAAAEEEEEAALTSVRIIDRHRNSTTMFRVGRDQVFPYWCDDDNSTAAVLCFVYGEIDCRCHIHIQRSKNQHEDDLIERLAERYIQAIKCKVEPTPHVKVVVVGVVPPATSPDQSATHSIHLQKDLFAIPFYGSDSDRLRYTRKLNALLEAKCKAAAGFVYFYPYAAYTDPATGMLRQDCADGTKVHIKDNSIFLHEFYALLARLCKEKEKEKDKEK